MYWTHQTFSVRDYTIWATQTPSPMYGHGSSTHPSSSQHWDTTGYQDIHDQTQYGYEVHWLWWKVNFVLATVWYMLVFQLGRHQHYNRVKSRKFTKKRKIYLEKVKMLQEGTGLKGPVLRSFVWLFSSLNDLLSVILCYSINKSFCEAKLINTIKEGVTFFAFLNLYQLHLSDGKHLNIDVSELGTVCLEYVTLVCACNCSVHLVVLFEEYVVWNRKIKKGK